VKFWLCRERTPARPPSRTDSGGGVGGGGGGRESRDNPRGVENAIFSFLGQPAFFSAGNRMTIVAFEKEFKKA